MNDADGYPSEEELTRVRTWPYGDLPGLFAYLKERWAYADMGYWVEENEAAKDAIDTAHVKVYRISTAGWSGNESLIEAMQENPVLWAICWYSARRGGHFEFHVPR